MRSARYPLWIAVLFVACSTNQSADTAEVEAALVKGIATGQKKETGSKPSSAVVTADAHLTMKTLTTGTFHEEEIWAGAVN